MTSAPVFPQGKASRQHSLRHLLRRLARDASGVAFIEFAYVLPILLTLGLVGADLARLAIVNMQVSQIALSVADNAARLGQTDNTGITPTIQEGDVDAVLGGAMWEGQSIDLEKNGRIILSSFEFHTDKNRQYIHWQRCRGQLNKRSAYGNDTDRNGLTGPAMKGIGQGTPRITAGRGTAVMFVEITYNYEGLLGMPYGLGEKELRHEGAFLIRDDRELARGLAGTSNRSRCGANA
jgi:Flp pilus assembly pilin Flp